MRGVRMRTPCENKGEGYMVPILQGCIFLFLLVLAACSKEPVPWEQNGQDYQFVMHAPEAGLVVTVKSRGPLLPTDDERARPLLRHFQAAGFQVVKAGHPIPQGGNNPPRQRQVDITSDQNDNPLYVIRGGSSSQRVSDPAEAVRLVQQ